MELIVGECEMYATNFLLVSGVMGTAPSNSTAGANTLFLALAMPNHLL
jgi:hypothetical protein